MFQYFLTDEAKKAGIDLKVPRQGDAGFDLPSLESVTIPTGRARLLRTGVHAAIPLGYVGLVRDRSSTAIKGAMCGAGVIDASYRGEIKVLLYNFGEEPLSFSPGDRIAQLVCLPHLTGEGVTVVSDIERLGKTERGDGGFGSTGK